MLADAKNLLEGSRRPSLFITAWHLTRYMQLVDCGPSIVLPRLCFSLQNVRAGTYPLQVNVCEDMEAAFVFAGPCLSWRCPALLLCLFSCKIGSKSIWSICCNSSGCNYCHNYAWSQLICSFIILIFPSSNWNWKSTGCQGGSGGGEERETRERARVTLLIPVHPKWIMWEMHCV